ncbi:hypothetical protein BKA65DRAFT_60258 [Rhexocercosporidium sp. MPI-PUGE-AT-0058]|nr:hypothetical protein BKA65DRAFT_60258 [Rhexocercosporidium sp. MPI-PUGE-AT-0058]
MASKAPLDHTTKRNSNSNCNSATLRRTCDACQKIKTRCSRDGPSCTRCVARNITCHYSISRRLGRPRRLTPASVSPLQRLDDNPPTSSLYIDWSGIDVDNDRMITKPFPNLEDSEASSNSTSADQRSQNDQLPTARVGQTPRASTSPSSFRSPRALVPELNEKEPLPLFNSMLGETDFSRLPNASLSSSLANAIEVPLDHSRQQSLDNSDIDRQSSSWHDIGQHTEYTEFAFSRSEQELDACGATSWAFSNGNILPERASACRCLESALAVTVSIGQGHIFPYPGAMDLALDVEAQLRETVPLAMQCIASKANHGEVFKLFANATADVVDLFQQLCNAEFPAHFPASSDPPTSQPQRMSSMLGGLESLQPKPRGHSLSNSHQLLMHHEHTISGSATHMDGTSNSGQNGRWAGRAATAHSHKLPSPLEAASIDQHQYQLQTHSSTEPHDWRILVGRHLIVGDDRKCMLIHLLRRRLCSLSNMLEGLIRAMQDLRMTLKGHVTNFSKSCNDDALNCAAEIDTRKPMKTASMLYDIMDQLEKIQI